MADLVLNRPLGRALKEEGMQRALEFSGAWKDTILADFKTWLEKQQALGCTTVTVEAFRAQSNNQPSTHFAWGALPNMALKAGLIAPEWAAPGLQARVKAAAPKTHAHEVKLWRLL
jgi:hypothetical protein